MRHGYSRIFRGEPICNPLDLVELIMAFEDEFGVEMSDSDCAGLATVSKTVARLQRLTASKPKPAR